MIYRPTSLSVQTEVNTQSWPSHASIDRKSKTLIVQEYERSPYTTHEHSTCYKIEFEVNSSIVGVFVEAGSQRVVVEYNGNRERYQLDALFPSPISHIEWTLKESQCIITAHKRLVDSYNLSVETL